MMAADYRYELQGILREHEPMSRHTTWRVGGPADRYYQPADIADLAGFVAGLPADEPVFWLGLGSNLLVRDGGLRGTVIATANLLDGIEQIDALTVRVEAGVPCAIVARFCARLGLVGAEFFAGIPGTLGGALAMNAGAFAGETWSLVQQVETLARSGQLHVRTPADYRIAYREVHGPSDEWFVAASLRLQKGDAAAAGVRIRELLSKRSASQPTSQANAGSVFRNPPGEHAARLIESCGLKGHCIGAACVSTKHANFIVNTGKATAADIETLIEHVAATVKQQCSVELQAEVHIVGEREHG
ncbi:MAG: UDP-N-acetylmuramate dehydrogenase [Thiohalomonadaceae bacterium]